MAPWCRRRLGQPPAVASRRPGTPDRSEGRPRVTAADSMTLSDGKVRETRAEPPFWSTLRSARIRAVGVPDWMFCGTYEAHSPKNVPVSCAPGRTLTARIGRLFPEARLRASSELSVMAWAWACPDCSWPRRARSRSRLSWADVVEARRACGHAGPCRSAGGRLVGERDDAVRRWGCAEKLQRERLAVATASRSPAD